MSKFSDSTFYLAPSGYRETILFPQKPLSSIGHLSVGRASSATRTNAAGQVEEVCYNLLQYSEDFSNGYWTKANTSVTSNSVTAPNGTLTADTLTDNGTNSTHTIDIGGIVGVTTYSIYAKKGTSNYVGLYSSSALQGVYWNLDTGVFSSNIGSAPTASSITSVGDGWYRCSITITGTSTATLRILMSNNGSSFIYAGTGQTIYIWGAQLVQGNLPKDYLYTSDRLNFPRVDYSDGSASLLLEPQRTNGIRNSTMVGATVGVSGNNPTNWGALSTAGLTYEITSIGIENGLNYIDYKFSGTATGAIVRFLFEGTSQIVASNGQTWTPSVYAKIINGSFDSSFVGFVQRDSGGSSLGIPYQQITLTSILSRVSTTQTISQALTAYAQPLLDFYVTSGQSYNFTVRIAQPQMELGAYVTTPIFTYGSAAVTRLADTFTRNNIYTNNLISSSGGTWFVDLKNNIGYTRDAGVVSLYIGDASSSPTNTFEIRNGGGTNITLSIGKRISNTFTTLFLTTTSTVKIAIKWNGTNADLFVNGTKQVSASSFVTTNMDFLVGNGVDVPKYITQMALWNTPLSDSQCIELTGVAYTTPAQAYGSLNLVSESPDCLYTSVNTINRI